MTIMNESDTDTGTFEKVPEQMQQDIRDDHAVVSVSVPCW